MEPSQSVVTEPTLRCFPSYFFHTLQTALSAQLFHSKGLHTVTL